MKKFCKKIMAIFALTAILLLSACAAPQQSMRDGKYDILFGASSTAGMAYRWVTPLCDLINTYSDTVTASAITTLGSSENINLLASNEVDFGTSTTIVAYSAASGQLDWKEKPVGELAVASYMYADYCYICVPEDSNVESIQDLKGMRVNIGEKGGGVYTGVLQVFNALGIPEEGFLKPYYLSMSEAVSSVIDGTLDAIIIYGSPNNSSISEMQASKSGLKVIGFTPEEIETICSANPVLKATVMQESYSGILPVATVGGDMCLFCRTDLPDEVTYEITRIINEYHEEFVQAMTWAEQSTLENVQSASNELLPLAGGTAQYIKENGAE